MDFEEELMNEVRCNNLLWDKRSDYYKNRAKTDRAWEAVANKLKKPKEHVKCKWRGLRDVFLREMKRVLKGHSGDAGSPSITSYSGKWPYFNDMWFLKDTVLPRPTEHNFEDNETEEGGTIDDVAGGSQIQEESREDNDAIQTSTQGGVQVPTDEQENIGDPDSNLVDISKNTPKRMSSSINRKCKKGKVPTPPEMTEFQKLMLQIEREKIAAFSSKHSVNRTDNDDDDDLDFLKSLAPYFKGLDPVHKLRLRSKVQNLIADEISRLHSSANPSTSSSTCAPSPIHHGYTDSGSVSSAFRYTNLVEDTVPQHW